MGKVALFLWLADEVIRRNPQGNKPVIFLSDRERVCMIVRASIYRKTRSASWICSCHGTVVEGGLVFL